MKARVLCDDLMNRYHFGEVGELLENNTDKYDYFLKLPGRVKLPDFLGGGYTDRCYYFYKHELEILEE